MRSDRVLNLYEQKDGTLWISTEDGLIKKDQDVFKTYLIIINSQVYAPSTIVENKDGTLWIIARGKPFKYENDEFVEVPVIQDNELAKKAIQSKNELWLAFEKKVLRTYGNSVVEVYKFDHELESNIVDFIEYPNGSGSFFLATNGNGVYRFMNGVFTSFGVEEGLASRYVWTFDLDKSNNVWVSSYNGQSIWNGNQFTQFNHKDIDSDIQLTSVYQDDKGNYWIGTEAHGFLKASPTIISTIGQKDGLENDKMLSLSQLSDGTMVFATNCGGIYKWNNGVATRPLINNYFPNQCIWSVFEDSRGYIWFGSKELYRSKSLNEPGEEFGVFNGFEGLDVYAITEDSKGNIWIGSFNGVFVFDGESFTKYTTADGLMYNDTRVFFEDENQKMWIGSSSGLSTFQNGKIEKIYLVDSSVRDINYPEPYIRAIYKDEDGIMWFGTYGDGIYRLKEGEISRITMNDGLADNIISHIVEDKNSNFWMGSNRGISRINRKQVNDYLSGKGEKITSQSFGIEDGMSSAETNGGFQPNVISDSLDNLYFPTISGVVKVSTKDVTDGESAPIVKIEQLKTDQGNIVTTDPVVLSYDNPFLEINYTAITFSNAHNSQFRYKMNGLDKSWIDVGNRRSAIYSNIPPGDYTFQVIASNGDGVWNNEGASVTISVVPPFWETWWFLSISLLGFMSIGPTIYFFRSKKLKSENERKKKFAEQLIDSQENERRRIASELHDGLGQQILVIKNRAELAKRQLSSYTDLLDQLDEIMNSAVISIGEVRSIAHGLRPVHLEKFGLTDAIRNMCNELRQSSIIEWSYHIDEIDHIIPEEKEINFYRVVQEAINNILKHSSADEASVIVRLKKDNINAIIWDNGKGFSNINRDDLGGLGFLGMKERVDSLGGEIKIESQPNEETIIRIKIPMVQ